MDTITAHMNAVYGAGLGEAFPQSVRVRTEFATEAEASEFAALFPKSYRVRTGRVSYSTWNGRTHDVALSNGESVVVSEENPNTFTVGIEVDLAPTKGNDYNEGGIKRLQNFLKKLDKAGHRYEYTPRNTNSYPSVEALAAAIGADLVTPAK